MTPLALGRHSGPALLESARPVFPVLLAAVVLAIFLTACRDQSNAYFIQGAALGTGYHVTLYADLDTTQVAILEASIQEDLAALERLRSDLEHIDTTAFRLFGLALSKPARQGVDRWLQVIAVDRLAQRLAAHDGIEAVMVEVGGVLRGHGVPPGGGWRVSLGQVGLPEAEASRQVHLQDAALVQRFVDPATVPLVSLASPLAVSVIAADASTAYYQAEMLVEADPGDVLMLANEMESAARVVVKTVAGIEIYHSRALKHWFER